MAASKAGGNNISDSDSTALPPPKQVSSPSTPTPPRSARESKRLAVRDEPGIGAFLVELQLDPAAPDGLRVLEPAELDRLRATKRIVAERADAVLELRTTMPPPEMHAEPPKPDVVLLSRAGTHRE
jgi:hypothetical protein